jgi:hypothetical protein
VAFDVHDFFFLVVCMEFGFFVVVVVCLAELGFELTLARQVFFSKY